MDVIQHSPGDLLSVTPACHARGVGNVDASVLFGLLKGIAKLGQPSVVSRQPSDGGASCVPNAFTAASTSLTLPTILSSCRRWAAFSRQSSKLENGK